MDREQQDLSKTRQLAYRYFYRAIQESFVNNLNSVLRVAGGIQKDGEIRNMQKGELAELSHLSKGTVTKLTTVAEDAKPDLETLCKIAYAINISPAFLLMTPRDWDLILQACGVLQMLRDPEGDQEKILMQILIRAANASNTNEAVIEGLEFMKQLQNDKYSTDERQRQKHGILAMTALAQSAMKRQGMAIGMQATALGAFLGDRDLAPNV